MNSSNFKTSGIAITNIMLLSVLVIMTAGSKPAYAQAAPLDPALEVFRVRCQIDQDLDPLTGLMVPKVQIQGKARADILDGFAVGIMVENISAINPPLPSIVDTTFELGTATADWDTFPDPGATTAVSFIPGDFVVPDESIRIMARVTSTGQTVIPA